MKDHLFTDAEVLHVLCRVDSFWDIEKNGSRYLIEGAFSLIQDSPILFGLEEKIVRMIRELTDVIEEKERLGWEKRVSVFLGIGSQIHLRIYDEGGELESLITAFQWERKAGDLSPYDDQKGHYYTNAADFAREIYSDHEGEFDSIRTLLDLGDWAEEIDLLRVALELDKKAGELVEEIAPERAAVSYVRAAKDSFDIYQENGHLDLLIQSGDLNLKAAKLTTTIAPGFSQACFHYAAKSFKKAFGKTEGIQHLIRWVKADRLYDENQTDLSNILPLFFAAKGSAEIFRRTDLHCYRTQAIRLFKKFLTPEYFQDAEYVRVKAARQILAQLEEVPLNKNLFKPQTVFL